ARCGGEGAQFPRRVYFRHRSGQGHGMLYLFYLLAAISVIAALVVVATRSPINSVIALVVCFLSIAGHYILLNAQFLAMVHVIVYTEATMVLKSFVIMLPT